METDDRSMNAVLPAPRWPWSADVDYLEATARQWGKDKTDANRNAFLLESLRRGKI